MKRIVCLLLALMLLLSSCKKETAYQATGDALMPEGYEGPVITAPPTDEVQSLILIYYPNVTMNPYQCTDFTNRALFSLLYQSLFVIDQEYKAEPMLCKQFSVSQDMMRYTIYLEDATFSDGAHITGQDVVSSLQAAREGPVYKGRFTHIGEITANQNAVTIHLTTPMADLPLLLDIPIVKASQVHSEKPLGTGPYFMESGHLQRRSNWWCTAVDMQITAPTIALLRAEDNTQIRDSFEFENLSLVCTDPCSDRYVDYRCDYELWDCENGMFMYLTFNKEKELSVFEDPALRAAVTYAIDRDKLAADYYRGFASATSLPASPAFAHYSQTLASRYDYEPEKFKQAIEDAGLTGKNLTLLVNKDDSLRLRVAQAIADMLEEGGVTVTIMALDGQEYTDSLLYRTFDLYLGQTRLSPNMDLSAFFHSTSSLSQGGVNDVAAYNLSMQALENHGNYYTLWQTVMDNGLLCPVLTGNYAIYATRGLLTHLEPARDNIFHYSLGRTLAQAQIAAPEPVPETTTPVTPEADATS